MFALARDFNKGPLQLNFISEKYEISEKYLSQIVIQLRHNGLINSTRGSSGGYYLSKNPDTISIKDIVECLEGSLEVVDLSEDSEKVPSIKEIWSDLNQSIKDTLNKYTLADIVNGEAGRSKEFMYYI
jgi:Rrf2 family transcriptional regulator, cysteine metabolism repressor